MNNAVLNTACFGVARLNCANLGDFMGSGSGGGIHTTLLPAEYQQVEYIESSGTQYIDTGVNADNKMGIEIKLLYTSGRFGAYQSSPKTRYHLYDNGRFGIGATNSQYGTVHNVGDIYIINCNFYNDLEYKENGIKTNSFPTNTFDANLNFWLFKKNPSDSFTGRIYYTKITVEDKLVRDFIPCYRKSDNEIGMYDIITDTFFTNQGTGTFLKGADVNKKYSPYIKGHITTADSSFTFSVDGKQKSVSVDANGDFKLKLNNPITSLLFVGVPQLESLELFAINGVTTFDVDYPTKVTYLRCDSTTKSAKNDVYHIRGTATDDFSFNIVYIDNTTSTTATVTENAIIDENGNWDIAYSGKRIRSLSNYFSGIKAITTIEFTDDLSDCVTLINSSNSVGAFKDTYLTKIKFAKGTSFKVGNIVSVFMNCPRLTEIINSESIVSDKTSVMGATGSYYGTFRGCSSLQTLDLSKSNFSNITRIVEAFTGCSSLENFYPNINSPIGVNLTLRTNPLSYESMERCVNWLKDYSNGSYVKMGKQSQSQWNNKTIDWYTLENDTYIIATTYSSTAIYYKLETQIVTFRKEIYDNLTLEQKTTLEGIAVQKGWILATSD